MKRKKIMHLLRPVEGGIKEHLRLLTEHLSSFYEFQIVCPPRNDLVSCLKRAGAEVIPLDISGEFKPVQDLRDILLLAALIRRKRPDLLHLHGFKAGFLGRMASFFSLKIPVVLTVHNYMAHQERSKLAPSGYYFVEKLLSRRTSRIVTVSEALKKNLLENMSIPGHKIIRIYNGINFEEFSQGKVRRKEGDSSEPQEMSGLNDNIIVGTAARLAPQKGMADFLRAAHLVLDKGMKCRFLIAGEGPLHKELEEQALSSGLQDHVDFLGYVWDMGEFFASLDIFVLPSRSEGLSITLLEALAAGRPAAAARVGGIPEIITDGVTGCLFPPEDPAALAETIIEMASSPEKRKVLAENGKSIVKKKFTVEQMVKNTAELYQELLS